MMAMRRVWVAGWVGVMLLAGAALGQPAQEMGPVIGVGDGAEATTQAATVVVATGGAGKVASTSFLDELRIDELMQQNRLRNWLVLLGAILVAMALGRVLTFVLERVAARLEKRRWHSQAEVCTSLESPGNLALFTLGLSVGLAQLVVSPLLADVNKRILLLLYTVALFWYAFNLVSVLEVALKKFTARTETTLDDDLVPVVRKALRVFIVVIGALFILQNVFERDIGAWLAGLGIAGLAVSLAAQDSLKNLFGSLTILFDRPFAMGQRIQYRGFDGVVEEIGFRSTKVRTADGSLVTIPNSNIVNDPVDNWGVRGHLLRKFTLTITYDTPVAKVKEAVEIVRGLLTSEEFRGPVHDPDTVKNVNPPRVHFQEFASDSLNIQVMYWYRPAAWWDFMAYNEKLNVRIMEEFERSGIEFAFPTRTVYLAGDPKRHLDIRVTDGGEKLTTDAHG